MWEMLESFKPITLNKREATIVILEEGPGNRGRNCYYGPEALISGVPIFQGCQVYADHPSSSEQEDLPERSVRDLIGRIKECWIERDETGKNQLRGILKVNDGKPFDWAVGLIKESIKAKKEGFPPIAQVSIHADGDINKRIIEGKEYNYVTKIKSAVSVDVVTKGGIKNSGFVEFMENALGGNKKMAGKMNNQRETEFRRIQAKLAESMTNDEAKFLESYLQEVDANSNVGADEDDEETEPEIFQDEAGNLFSATGQMDENGNQIFLNEAGEGVVFPEEEIEEPVNDDENDMEFEDDEDDEIVEPDDLPPASFRGNDDEIPISELVAKYPHLAQEISQEELGVEESDRDYDIVKVKLENKLLKSRIIAEHKLSESKLPPKVIRIKELVGKSPEEMDNIIESRAAMLETVAEMTQGAVAAMGETSLRENGDDMTVGRRILRNSCMPS